MSERRDDPYLDCNFVVEIDGVEAAAFSEVELPTARTEAIAYRDGADRQSAPRLLPGRVTYGPLVLRRGFAGDLTLYEWWRAVADGTPDRRDVAVQLLNERREPVARWRCNRAWPTKYEAAPLDARGNAVEIETVELAVEGVELE